MSIGQLGGFAIDEVWRWVLDELHRRDPGYALQNRFAHSVHAVHYAPLSVQDDWMTDVAFQDLLHVLNDASRCWPLHSVEVPVIFVEFGELAWIDHSNWKLPGNDNESADIEGIYARARSPQVVLRPQCDHGQTSLRDVTTAIGSGGGLARPHNSVARTLAAGRT